MAIAQESGEPVASEMAEAEGMDPVALAEATTAIETWVEAQRLFRDIPALSAAIVRGQDTVWAKGFGHTDRARTMPATPDTIYSICSISKLFTSIAAMQQWEAGRLRLDEPVATYLPWATLAPDDRDSVPITLRNMMSHSAGLPRESDFAYWSGPDYAFPSREQVRETIGRQAPLYAASREYQYSNLGLTLVGEAVAAVSGQDYGDYVRANVIAPLGLANTRAGFPHDLYGGQMAVGWGSRGRDGQRPAMPEFDTGGILPAAGFTSTANDLARFAAWHFRLLGSERHELLNASTLREMTRVQFLGPDWGRSYGLGYAVQRDGGRTIVGHGGSCPGYETYLMMELKSETAVAVLMNAHDDPYGFARAIGAVVGARADANAFPAAPGNLTDYAGLYDQQPWSPEVAIMPWAGGLAVLETSTPNLGDMTRLRHVEGDTFRVILPDGAERETVSFARDADGRVTHIEWFSNRYPRK